MRVLVTGAAGFVGLHLVSELAAAGHETWGLSRSVPPERAHAALGGPVRFEMGDVRDRAGVERLVAELRPNWIVHAAAITPSHDDELARPEAIVETNELSTLSLLTAAARHDVTRVLFLSSAGVYADPPDGTPIDEDAPVRVTGGLYAITKLGGERLCRWATERLGVDTRIVRIGPVYGEFERPTGSRQGMSLAYRVVTTALRGEPLRGDRLDATYDWIHGIDAARAMIAVLAEHQLARDTYNLAGEPVSMARLLNAVAQAVPGTSVEWVETGQANVPVPSTYRRAPLECVALARDTGYHPSHSIESGITAYVNALRNDGRMEEAPG